MNAVNCNRKAIAALVAAGLLLPPAFAAPPTSKRRPPAIALHIDRVSNFTPAVADPRLAAAFAGRLPLAGDLKFTPAPSAKRPSQRRVAIRARAATPTLAARAAKISEATSAASVSALTPESYNLGVAVGWRQFAVAGDVARIKAASPVPGGREGAAVAISYSLKRFTGRVSASADRPASSQAAALANSHNYALDLGGAYNVSGKLAVTGGVRYKIERDRLSTLADQRRDSQAVYVGTAFKF